MRLFWSRFKSDEGATAVEYALIAGLIAAIIVGAVTTLGTTIQGIFDSIVKAF